MDTIWKNITYSVRMLLKRPGFTAVAVIAIALGIGANTAIFSVVNTVLLRPLPFEKPEQLIYLSTEQRNQPTEDTGTFSVPDLLDVRDRATTLKYVASYQRSGTIVTEGGEPERLIGAAVTADYFPLFGVKPILGRFHTREEDQPGAAPVIVISHSLWQRRFGGDPNIIGREVTIGGKTTVIGVMPPGFEFPLRDDNQDYWEPMFAAAFLNKKTRETRDERFLQVVGRLKDGATIEQAKAELDNLSRQVEQQFPITNTGLIFDAVSVHEEITREYRSALLIMLGAVGLVLLIACANVANLQLARATARKREIAIRAALGASRGRIAGQLLTESLILAIVGGAAGLLLAAWGLDVLVKYGPPDVPRLQEVQLDNAVLGFTAAVSVITGVIFGLLPALHASRSGPGGALKEGAFGSTDAGSRSRMRSALIVVEVAFSLMLLVGAGLLINTFVRLLKTDAGFDPRGVLAMDIPLSRTKYPKPEQQLAAFQQLLEQMKSIPGVRDVSVVSNVPFSDFDTELSFNIEGKPPYRPGEELAADDTTAGPNYFRTMNITLLRGRDFSNQDTTNTPHVMIVSNAFARKFLPGEEPIGKRILMDGDGQPPREIIGVVNDVRRNGLDIDVEPEMYVSYLQSPTRRLNIMLKTDAPNPAQMATTARETIRAFDPNQIIWRTQTLDEMVSKSVAPRRFNMMILGVFAGVALILAAVGLYGVMSYSVNWRTNEIGIRMALGARASDVIALVVREGMVLTLIGLAIGLAGALIFSRIMTSLLYGVSARDPLTFAGVSAVLLFVALVACLIPARRATKVDPLIALRAE
ncbi:MAG TPA: ABC transporter permease [Pyrinomonadaceae bacterium]|nr:ABC transporter permease [Pyrinomonadaceae bacterium]